MAKGESNVKRRLLLAFLVAAGVLASSSSIVLADGWGSCC